MNFDLRSVLPAGIGVLMSASVVGLLAFTRPNEPTEAATPLAPQTETATSPPALMATRTPTAVPTPTRPPLVVPTIRGAAVTPSSNTIAQPLQAISGPRFAFITVLQAPPDSEFLQASGEAVIEFVASLPSSGPTVSFFFAPLGPGFPVLTGNAPLGAGFDESGGLGQAVGSGRFEGSDASFGMDFQVSERQFNGTLRVVDHTGKVLLALRIEGDSVLIP